MKKLFISLLLLAATPTAFAQLKVKSDGSVRLGSSISSLTPYSVHVCDSAVYESSTFYGLISSVSDKIAYRGVGVKGAATLANNMPSSRIGVWGEAGYGDSFSYGVIGQLAGTSNGAAVYGMLGNSLTYYYGAGQYAGLFNGETRVLGDLTATNMYTSSDIRLKNNVLDISEGESSNTLDKLMNVNVIKYNLRRRLSVLTEVRSLRS